MGKIRTPLILGLFVASVVVAGCGGGDESSAGSQQTASTKASQGATYSTADPEKIKADRIAKAKEAMKRGAEQERKALKKQKIEPDDNASIPKPKPFNPGRYEPDPSGKNATSGFATFAIPAGWKERPNTRAGDIPKSQRLTQLVPANEGKGDSAGASYTATIAVQKLSNVPSWATKSDKSLIQYAMVNDGVEASTAVSLTVDGARAIGFGLTSAEPNLTSVYTVRNGDLYQINGGRTAPNGSPSAVQKGILTIINTWSWN